MGLPYWNGSEVMGVWSLIPIDDESDDRFADFLIAEQARYHKGWPDRDHNQMLGLRHVNLFQP